MRLRAAGGKGGGGRGRGARRPGFSARGADGPYRGDPLCTPSPPGSCVAPCLLRVCVPGSCIPPLSSFHPPPRIPACPSPVPVCPPVSPACPSPPGRIPACPRLSPAFPPTPDPCMLPLAPPPPRIPACRPPPGFCVPPMSPACRPVPSRSPPDPGVSPLFPACCVSSSSPGSLHASVVPPVPGPACPPCPPCGSLHVPYVSSVSPPPPGSACLLCLLRVPPPPGPACPPCPPSEVLDAPRVSCVFPPPSSPHVFQGSCMPSVVRGPPGAVCAPSVCLGLLRAPPAQGTAALGMCVYLGRVCPPCPPKAKCHGGAGGVFLPSRPTGGGARTGGGCLLFGGAEPRSCRCLTGSQGIFCTCLCRRGTARTSHLQHFGVSRTQLEGFVLSGEHAPPPFWRRLGPKRAAGQGWRLPGFRGGVKVSSVTFQPLPPRPGLAPRESFRHLLSKTRFTVMV